MSRFTEPNREFAATISPPFERGYLKALKDLLEEIFQCLEGTPSQSKSRQETLCSQNRAEDPSD